MADTKIVNFQQRESIRNIIDNVSNDLNKLVSKPEKYKENYGIANQ